MEKSMNSSGPEPAGTELYHDIPMRDGFMSPLKVHKPAEGPPGPLIVYAFGGGFIGGSNEQLTLLAHPLVNLVGATVVNISYRVAPEHKYPASQNDALDSMKWIADNATGPVLNSDPKKGFIMGGVSAGGAITACLSRMFQEEPLPYPLTGQWLSVPSIMESSIAAQVLPEKYRPYYLSAEQQAKNPLFSREARDQLKKFCEWDASSPFRYAINSKTPLSDQPRTYFQADGMDPLRDDSMIYEELLKEAGVETRIDVYPGCPHGHAGAFPGLEITNRANIDTIVGIAWLLRKDITREQAAKELGL